MNPFLRSRTTTDKAPSDDKPEDDKSEDKADDNKSDGDKPTEDKPSDEKKGGLFGASMKGGLFQKTTDLFGKQRSSTFGGRSLFDGKSTFNQRPGFLDPEKKADEEEKEKPEEATVIKAADDSLKLYSHEVNKFTLMTGTKGSGTVSIEEKKDESKQGFLVFRNGIGKTLFTGVILKMHTAEATEGKPTQCLARVTCSTKEEETFKITPA